MNADPHDAAWTQRFAHFSTMIEKYIITPPQLNSVLDLKWLSATGT